MFSNSIDIHCFEYNGDGTFTHIKRKASKCPNGYLLASGKTIKTEDLRKLKNNKMYSTEYDIVDFLQFAIQQENLELEQSSNGNTDGADVLNRHQSNIEKLTDAYCRSNIT